MNDSFLERQIRATRAMLLGRAIDAMLEGDQERAIKLVRAIKEDLEEEANDVPSHSTTCAARN